MKDTLTYPSLEKMARIFRAGIPVELCVKSETSTLSGNTCKSKRQGRKTENKMQVQAHVVGLVEKFHAQT